MSEKISSIPGRLRPVVLFSSDHAQSDGKIMQIRKVNEDGLGRGRNFALTEIRRTERDCSQSSIPWLFEYIYFSQIKLSPAFQNK